VAAGRKLGATRVNELQAKREQRKAERATRKLSAAAEHAREVMAKLVDDAAGPQDAAELKALLSRLMLSVASGSIPPAAASAASSLANALSKVLEVDASSSAESLALWNAPALTIVLLNDLVLKRPMSTVGELFEYARRLPSLGEGMEFPPKTNDLMILAPWYNRAERLPDADGNPVEEVESVN
jgi:hypothetical protein